MKERIEVLLSAEQIDRRMAELADELYQEFGDEQVELVCALKGAVVTIVDLAKKMKMPVTMNFMSVSSYGNSTESFRQYQYQDGSGCGYYRQECADCRGYH